MTAIETLRKLTDRLLGRSTTKPWDASTPPTLATPAMAAAGAGDSPYGTGAPLAGDAPLDPMWPGMPPMPPAPGAGTPTDFKPHHVRRAEAAGEEDSERAVADGPAGEIEDRIVAALRQIYDPEIPVNIYDIGLIYEIDIDPEAAVNIKMTLTSPACPVAGTLPPEVEQKVGAVDGVHGSKVEITWEPAWTPEMMSEPARLELGML